MPKHWLNMGKFMGFEMSAGGFCLGLFSIGIRRLRGRRLYLICSWTRRRSRRRRTKSERVQRVSPAPTEPRSFGEGGGGWRGSISESFSHPHSPVRHGSERTSCAAPDNDDRITLNSAGNLGFLFEPPLNGI